VHVTWGAVVTAQAVMVLAVTVLAVMVTVAGLSMFHPVVALTHSEPLRLVPPIRLA
tara:strand:+ start:1447 stop:1614 length:168 start_codon:yes stop_codon:yes gene_type:complete